MMTWVPMQTPCDARRRDRERKGREGRGGEGGGGGRERRMVDLEISPYGHSNPATRHLMESWGTWDKSKGEEHCEGREGRGERSIVKGGKGGGRGAL